MSMPAYIEGIPHQESIFVAHYLDDNTFNIFEKRYCNIFDYITPDDLYLYRKDMYHNTFFDSVQDHNIKVCIVPINKYSREDQLFKKDTYNKIINRILERSLI